MKAAVVNQRPWSFSSIEEVDTRPSHLSLLTSTRAPFVAACVCVGGLTERRSTEPPCEAIHDCKTKCSRGFRQ